MTMDALPDRSHLYVGADGVVDVAKLIQAYSSEEHAVRADRYFDDIRDPWAHQLRKPFHEVGDTRTMLAGLAAVLELAAIRPGDTVVDFGCGTGWLTVALSMMRCKAIGVDISAAALRLARGYADLFPATRTDPVRFEVICERLPLEDASVDRVICFDAFHHVRDPEGALGEFARVLRPGGMAVFHEPGPRHSTTPVSQMEMREFAVIENDVVLERLWPAARAHGFSTLKLAAYTSSSVMLTLDAYNAAVQGAAEPAQYEAIGRAVVQQGYDRRVFSLGKPLHADLDDERDSRARDLLAGEVALAGAVQAPSPGWVRAQVEVRNTGEAWWRPSGSEAGDVNLAARLAAPDGRVRDLRRFDVSSTPVLPGEARLVPLDFALPVDLAQDEVLVLELVSEFVGWFADLGSPGVRTALAA